MSCSDKNKLIREGTSHPNRVLAALSTSFAKVDERDNADILLFAKRYAAYLKYYNSSNIADEDWQPLMKMDISVTLATLAKIDTTKIAGYKKILYKRIKQSDTEADAKAQFKFIFDLIFSLTKLVDEQYRLIPGDLEYKTLTQNAISAKMKQALVNLDHLHELYSNPALTNFFIDKNITLSDADAPINVFSSGQFDKNELSSEWYKVNNPVPPPLLIDLSANIDITLPDSLSVKEKIIYLIHHNLFNDLIESLLKGVAAIVSRAGDLFKKTIDDFPSHSPHYALFLSFIKLFRHAQDHLNTYTQRHLDFYYKDVLQLKNKSAEPDSAHLVFELQKPVLKHLLKRDTLFKGGKDSTGKEINYLLTDDIVFNKATVAKIHSQQLMDNGSILLASPIAASADGQGAEIKAADKSWFTFGDSKKASPANTGFAIASNLLYLKEGTRKVTITIYFEKPIFKTAPGLKKPVAGFSAKLTGEKDWHEIPDVTLHILANNTGQKFVFTFTLSPNAPSIVPYTEKIHKDNFYAGLPVVKFFLKQGEAASLAYNLLCKKKISAADIAVTVTGVKDLMLSNDMGSIDASKPFKPFGDFPGEGASFYIGSKEIFQKELTTLDLNFAWKSNEPRLFPARYLHLAEWSNDTNSFTIKNGHHIEFSPAKPFNQSAINFEKNEPLKANSLEGFLRIQLNSGNHSLETHLANISKTISNSTIRKVSSDPNKYQLEVQATPIPEEIILDSFSITYTAKAGIRFNETQEPVNHLFFYLTSFGYKKVHPLLVDTAPNTEAVKKITLLADIIHEGELFIGFEQALPNLVLNILFQVADGSSNPLKNMETLEWFYLSYHNNWKKFETQFVIDRTKNFTQSGIVTLTLPDDISNDATLLQKGLHWIKVAVKENCDAVCKMLLIQAQAAKVSLVQDDIKQIEFRECRSAGSISKLVNSDASVKTISQPFDSFSGRTRETDEHFYIRVSERLRHKQRAVTIWDYEHIILEKFPEVFKVKCLNHSGFYKKNDAEVFCENYPGHVTVITLPDLNNKTNINPLRPYTPIGLLQNINDYLKKITSPFVKLHVKNPVFEEIQLDFEVKFHDNFDESFYLQLLNWEIEKFLCPWAYNGQAEITFGGKIRKSSILNFVEERTYVDYVTSFIMNHVIQRSGTVHTEELRDIEVAEGTTSRSILVSYYNEETGIKHIIKSPASCEC